MSTLKHALNCQFLYLCTNNTSRRNVPNTQDILLYTYMTTRLLNVHYITW